MIASSPTASQMIQLAYQRQTPNLLATSPINPLFARSCSLWSLRTAILTLSLSGIGSYALPPPCSLQDGAPLHDPIFVRVGERLRNFEFSEKGNGLKYFPYMQYFSVLHKNFVAYRNISCGTLVKFSSKINKSLLKMQSCKQIVLFNLG